MSAPPPMPAMRQAPPIIRTAVTPTMSGPRQTAGSVVRVRAPAPLPGMAQPIKVVGAAPGAQGAMLGSPIGAAAPAGISGIDALAAAAASKQRITTVQGSPIVSSAAGQTIKVVQQGGNLVTTPGMKMAAPGQTAVIGGQTVRLASSPAGGSAGTLLKAGTHLASPGGKQIILQKQGLGGGVGQPQIVTLVKTSQGMQVATVPKASIVQGGKPGAAQQIVQAAPGK